MIKGKARKLLHTSKGRFTLLECLVYIGLLSLTLNLGTVYLLRLWEGHGRQQDFVDRTVKTVLAGRRLKRDIRDGTSIEDVYGDYSRENGELIIRYGEGVYIYRLEGNRLRRLTLNNGEAERKTFLREVRGFEFREKNEGGVHFLTIDLELEKRPGRHGPAQAFTFKGVL